MRKRRAGESRRKIKGLGDVKYIICMCVDVL